MAEPFLSQITMFAGNFAPRGYALCNGQILSIQQNTALFSLLGTTFGGDGVTTFGLPNLQCRLPVGMGQGPGLSNYNLGQLGGLESVTLTTNQMPAHTHAFMASTSASATTASAVGPTVLPGTPSATGAEFYLKPAQPGQPPLDPVTLAAAVCSTTGQSQPHSNLMPSLCITFVIALVGVFPSRN
jgi:microcystin-dependent protein